ncbi:MAG: nucleotide-binding protein [Acidobacteria bacterium]|nr:nucleotide-binding protein [Acidobacteriota bacterium]
MASRKAPQSPQFTSKQFSVFEIDRGIEKLKKRRGEVLQLNPTNLAAGDPVRGNIQRSIRDTVADIFGANSREASDFINPQLYYNPHPVLRGYGDEDDDNTPFFVAGIEKMAIELQGLIEKLEERRGDVLAETSAERTGAAALNEQQANTREVFIVHGHDDAAKLAVARFIQQIGLQPVILHEQTNRGSTTVIEKLERHSNVPFAIVLLTPDDVGAQKSNSSDLTPRARQNVILELGYFLGKLGRGRVCPLYKEGVEIPSDFSGVIYTPLDPHDGWKLTLAKELRVVWSDIDLNRI